jgi:hypothetical protein
MPRPPRPGCQPTTYDWRTPIIPFSSLSPPFFLLLLAASLSPRPAPSIQIKQQARAAISTTKSSSASRSRRPCHPPPPRHHPPLRRGARARPPWGSGRPSSTGSAGMVALQAYAPGGRVQVLEFDALGIAGRARGPEIWGSRAGLGLAACWIGCLLRQVERYNLPVYFAYG